MHEIRIASDLSGIVLEAAEKNKLSKITRVDVCVGRMVQLEPEAFEFAFREAVKGTSAFAAELAIEIIPVKLRCRSCGNISELSDNHFLCSCCNSCNTDIINGTELFIKAIEGE